MYGYIYKTTNLINNKIYIGQHKGDKQDPKYVGSGTRLKEAIKKYGLENFKCEVIEFCETVELCNEREKYWITFYNSRDKQKGYNLAHGGLCNPGHQLSEKEKEIRSLNLTRRNLQNWQNTEYRENR